MTEAVVAGVRTYLGKASLRWITICMTSVMVLVAGTTTSAAEVAEVVVERSRSVAPDRDADPVLNNLERRTFRYFWNTTNRSNGMVPDRYPSPSFASIAAVGFDIDRPAHRLPGCARLRGKDEKRPLPPAYEGRAA